VSVRGKLATAITLVIGAIAALIYLIFPTRLERQALRALADKAESIGAMTAFSVSSALLFSDKAGVSAALHGAQRNLDLAYVVVVDDTGQLVGAIGHAASLPGDARADLEVAGASRKAGVYRTIHPITTEQRRVIGTLYLGLFMKEVNEEVSAARRTTALWSVLLLVVGAVASFMIGTFVSRPLREIVTAAERIAGGDLTQRAPVSSQDEVAQLARSFNNMVARLADAQADLSQSNHTLETRVANRTAELLTSEARFRGVVGSLAEGIVVTNRDHVIQHVNERAGVLVGFAPEELVGEILPQVLLPADEHPDYLRRAARRHNEGKSDRREHQYVRRDGTTVWMEIANVPLRDDNGLIIGSVATLWELTERKQLEDRLRHDAGHDSLTGLPNRASFLESLRRVLAEARHANMSESVAVMFLDLDDFKKVNDSLGHAAGDSLLREVTARLLSATRGCDTVARLGGDEFAILLSDVQVQGDATIVARRALQSLAQPIDLDGTQVLVTASVGIALAISGDGPDELLRNADVAMYSAKQNGKETFVVFAHSMHEEARARLELEAELRHALEHDELRVFYQPIVDLRTGTTVGLEALIRWAHPRRGMVGPNAFIPVAESTGLIGPIGSWVLNRACRDAVAWNQGQRATLPPTGVSVNVSARQLRDGHHLVADVRSALLLSGLSPDLLQLEITETLIMSDADATLSTLNALSALGVQLAIDDFGTGYSSLSYLERFPVDTLKIDKAFVDRIAHDGTESPLPAAIIRLGRTLGLRVIAEGIETVAQAERLAELGCDYGQGFLFSQPLPIEKALSRQNAGPTPVAA
jgi:diguanylate cyclase (GGDEF)-like protein/PAS domain S-box-containing protein